MNLTLPMRAPRNAGGSGAVIASAPIVSVLRDLRTEIAVMKRWSPNSDVATALESMCDKMERALRDAQRTDVWLTVKEVAALAHRPPSTVSRICRDHEADAGARKVKGVWTIHWPTFESFVMAGRPTNAQEAA